MVSGYTSDQINLNFGVPQGSVPLNMSPVGDIARRHKLGHQFYADDSQLYVNFKPNTTADSALTNLEACIADIKHWMLVNLLKLNDDKTEIMLFGSPYFINVMPKISVISIGYQFGKGLFLKYLAYVQRSQWQFNGVLERNDSFFQRY